MNTPCRAAFTVGLALLASSLAASSSAQPIVQGDPVVVAEEEWKHGSDTATLLRSAPTETLDQRSLRHVSDHVANLHVAASGAGAFGAPMSVRGLSNTPYFSDPSLAVTFDDVPLGNAFTFPTELFSFAEVSVARGPQLTIGPGAEGGAITFSSSTAGEIRGGEVRLSAGNHALRSAAFEARSARGTVVDATVSAAWSEREGYIRNAELGRTVDDQNNTTGSARVRLRPNARTEISVQLLGSRRRDGAQPLVPQTGAWDEVRRGREGATESDFVAGALKLAFKPVGGGDLTAVTSASSWLLQPYSNRLVLPPPLDSDLALRQRAWNQEVRFSRRTAAVEWLVGGWLSDRDTAGRTRREIPGLFPIEASSYALTSRTAAVFGRADYPLSRRWRIGADLRAQSVRRTFDRRQTVPAEGHFAAERTFAAILPKLRAEYSPSRDLRFSLSVGRGTKPGGWSAYTDSPSLAAFRSEHVTATEATAQWSSQDRRFDATVRLFGYSIRDYQIERSFTATDYLVVNAPRARSIGGELELRWRVSRVLTLTGALGANETTLRRFVDPFTGADYSGRTAPYAPRHDLHVGGVYRPIEPVFLAVDLTSTGETHFDESESPDLTSGSHLLVNGQVGYEGSRWRVVAYVRNATGREYASLIVPGIGHRVPGAPRTYGMEVTWRW